LGRLEEVRHLQCTSRNMRYRRLNRVSCSQMQVGHAPCCPCASLRGCFGKDAHFRYRPVGPRVSLGMTCYYLKPFTGGQVWKPFTIGSEQCSRDEKEWKSGRDAALAVQLSPASKVLQGLLCPVSWTYILDPAVVRNLAIQVAVVDSFHTSEGAAR